jgi:MATE family multidrug resistance protein
MDFAPKDRSALAPVSVPGQTARLMAPSRLNPPGRTRAFSAPRGLGELLSLAWPVVLGRLGVMTMGLTDTVVVGRYSAEQLAWHAIAWAPTVVVLITGVGLSFGVQVMTSRYAGEGRLDLVGGVLRRGLVFGWLVGLAAGLLLAFAGPPFLKLVGLAPDLAAGAAWPLRVFSLSLPVYGLAVAATLFLEGLGRPKAATAAMWLANGVNLLVNLWLVPGHSGLPVDGAVAAAWATLAARVALVIALLVWIARLPEARAMGVFERPRDGPGAGWAQIRIGLGSGAATFVEMGAFSGMTLIMGRLGGLEAAAWSIVLSVTAMVFMPPLGVSTATGVLVGRAVGARDGAGVRRATALGLGVAAVQALVIAGLVWLCAGAIASAYVSDPAAARLAAGATALSCLFFVPDALQVVAAQALRARGDVWWPTAFHLTSYAAIMLPLGWLFAEHWRGGVAGAVWAVIVASLVSGGLLTGRCLLVERAGSATG